jgi:hypothetical protein
MSDTEICIGDRVCPHMPEGMENWFQGTVTDRDQKTGRYTVKWDDVEGEEKYIKAEELGKI